MGVNKLFTAIGLMSGTSLDGIDVALIETDGHDSVTTRGAFFMAYPDELRAGLRACFGKMADDPACRDVARDMTLLHAQAVKDFLVREQIDPASVDLIGFHGQTIHHDPRIGVTVQIGDGSLLARATGIDVISDFRTQDVRRGGQGAPLLPVYHRARIRASGIELPVAILNIGGVSNVTWIGGGTDDFLAFDCGPGNALMDDLVLRETGERFDRDGVLAARGAADREFLNRVLSLPYFDVTPPKSLDRQEWASFPLSDTLSLPDKVATLTAFTVGAIVKGAAHFPAPALSWFVTGGGRHNPVIMRELAAQLGVPVRPVDDLGWDGDCLEAEGFAYMAVRSILGLPISFPGTTGVSAPCCGGKRDDR